MNSSPRVSYIVSTYRSDGNRDRWYQLPALLWSLKSQSDPNYEVIVTDNSTEKRHQDAQRRFVDAVRNVESVKDDRFQYVITAGKIKVSDCYWSAEWAAKRAKGEWLCFPCDDCYYVPDFQERMLEVADLYGLDAVLCDAVYRYNVKRYSVLHAKPGLSISAKSSFMVKRSIFPGFRTKPQGAPAPTAADSAMLGDLRQAGYRCGNAQDVMVVHN